MHLLPRANPVTVPDGDSVDVILKVQDHQGMTRDLQSVRDDEIELLVKQIDINRIYTIGEDTRPSRVQSWERHDAAAGEVKVHIGPDERKSSTMDLMKASMRRRKDRL